MLTKEQIDQVIAFVEEQTGHKLQPTGSHHRGLLGKDQIGTFVGYVRDPEALDQGPVPGRDGFLVFEFAVLKARIDTPFNHNDWTLFSADFYSDKETLSNLLPKKPEPKQSAWATDKGEKIDDQSVF